MSLIETSPTTPEATTGADTDLLFTGTTANETSALSMLLGYDTSGEATSVEVDFGGFAANDIDAIFGGIGILVFSFSQP
jgi:hypothetical protein